MVAIQLSDSSGIGFGSWNKIFAYENEYDAQGTDQFSNCTFDPIDDGNDEDSFFNPSDPLRRLGPSSTCKPEFVFSWGGDTDYRNVPGKLDIIGRAFDGPGLKGSVDRGTWVQPKFSLNEFKGRRLRLRFLATSIEVNPAVTYNDTNIGSDNNTFDDGWYIDTVSVPTALATPATALGLSTGYGRGNATHVYFAKQLGVKGGPLDYNEMYGALLPDLLNLEPGYEALANAFHFNTDAMLAMYATAPSPQTKAAAYGFLSHNNAWRSGLHRTWYRQTGLGDQTGEQIRTKSGTVSD